MQRRPRGVSQAFRDEEIHGEYEESKDEDDDDDELPRSTSFMANNLTRTLLAASERNPTSYMSKAMSTQGRAAKTFAKEFNPEPSKKQYNKARGLVDGTGVFVEESAEPAENELYPTFSRASTRGSLKTRGSVDSWTITDGGARSETVTPAALPPAMVAADRIFRPKRRVQTVYL